MNHDNLTTQIRGLLAVAHTLSHTEARMRLDAILTDVPTRDVNVLAKVMSCWTHNRKGLYRLVAEVVENYVSTHG